MMPSDKESAIGKMLRMLGMGAAAEAGKKVTPRAAKRRECEAMGLKYNPQTGQCERS